MWEIHPNGTYPVKAHLNCIEKNYTHDFDASVALTPNGKFMVAVPAKHAGAPLIAIFDTQTEVNLFLSKMGFETLNLNLIELAEG